MGHTAIFARPATDTDAPEDPSQEAPHTWTRWAPMVCVAGVGFGMSFASAWMIWAAATVALCAAVLPHHPVDYFYNSVIRRLTGTAPLPRSTSGKKHACMLSALLLAGAGGAFFVGSASVGYALGFATKLYMRFWDRPDPLGLATRIATAIPRLWA
ncbi:MAG: DUF4395 family protein [Myxococcota bacterium]